MERLPLGKIIPASLVAFGVREAVGPDRDAQVAGCLAVISESHSALSTCLREATKRRGAIRSGLRVGANRGAGER